MQHCFLAFDDHRSRHRAFALLDVPAGLPIERLFNDFYDATRSEVSDRIGIPIILRPPARFQLPRAHVQAVLNNPDAELPEAAKLRLQFLSDARRDPESAFKRFRDQPVLLLASDTYQPYLTRNINPLARELEVDDWQATEKDWLGRIRQAEMEHLLSEGRCRLPLLGDYYYRLPSGRITRSFLRVGNLQRSQHALDCIFFWLLPSIENCAGVITDTWSIGSLSQNISRRLMDYDTRIAAPCPIEMLAGYRDAGGQAIRIADAIDSFLTGVSQNQGIVLVLISATHTGGLQHELSAFLDSREIADRARYVSLFKLSQASDVPTLCDLSDDFNYELIENPNEKNVIDIDDSIYFPVQERDIEKIKTLDFATAASRFADPFARMPFCRVHYTDAENPATPRHHAVWIDTAVLIENTVFQEKLRAEVLSLQPEPALIICPGHTSARRMAQLACDILGGRPQVHAHENLSIHPDSEPDLRVGAAVRALGPSEAILFMDDAFITGSRIRNYQTNLRELNEHCVLHYLAAISRPDSAESWKKQQKTFQAARAPRPGEDSRPGNTFQAIETLILPNWGKNDCPWCLEETVADKLPAPLRRLERLRGAVQEGLTADLFNLGPGIAQPALRSGAFWGPEGMPCANLVCLVANVLQRLRTEPCDGKACLGSRDFLVATVLGKDVYLRHYTDPVLVACILRAARPHELTYRNREIELIRAQELRRQCADNGNTILGELLVAHVTGKLPNLDKDDAHATLLARTPEPSPVS